MSKQQRVGNADADIQITIPTAKIMDFCKVSYSKAVSVEIIDHLIGGDNMEYKAIEVENSFQCYHVCRNSLLENIKNDQKEILFFDDRKGAASDVIVAVTKQPKTNKKREHIILLMAIRLTIELEPPVGFRSVLRFDRYHVL